MRWETGSAEVMVLELEWLWENCSFLMLSFSRQAFSYLWTTTSGVYPPGLKSVTPKMHWKSLLTFEMRGYDSNCTQGRKYTLMFAGSSTSVVWDLLCWDVRLSSSTILEQGLLGLSIPVFREHSFLISRYTGRFIRDRKWGRKSEVRLHERSWTARRVFSWTSPGSFVRGPFFCRQLYQALCWNTMSGV